MTTITLKKDGSLMALRVNGRLIGFDPRITKIENVSAGRWEGIAGGKKFWIVGGRESGGGMREWFVQWDTHGDHVFPVKSCAAALRIIENS